MYLPVLPTVTTAERREWEAHQGAVQKEIESLRAALDARHAGPSRLPGRDVSESRTYATIG